jgi:hypothetical protein
VEDAHSVAQVGFGFLEMGDFVLSEQAGIGRAMLYGNTFLI